MTHVYGTGTLIEFYMQSLLKALKELFIESRYTDLSKLMALYMILDNSIGPFQMFLKRYKSLSQLL